MSQHPDLVDWRRRHGSRCEWCPLNDQRKVGADGPVDAPHIGIGEAPGADEAEYGVTRGFKYGRPFIGKSGYFWKLEYLVPAGLARLSKRPGKNWPGVELTKIQVLNTIMCQPPKNKIDSPQGRAAQWCCVNGLLAWLRRRRQANPDLMVTPVGGTALRWLLRAKASIDQYRGRVLTELDWDAALAPIPESDIIKKVFRGKTPTDPQFLAHASVIEQILRWQRNGLAKQEKAVAEAAKPEVVTVLEILIKRQRLALSKAVRATTKEAA